jgi:excisionase family DNA binding protein
MGTTTPASSEPLVTVAGIARLLGVPPSFIYEKTARGEIPCIKVGRYNRYRVSDVLRALEQGGQR